MAYVTDLPLNTVWIMDPTNPAVFVACGSSASISGGSGGRVKDLQLPGEFREYAGGRYRLVLRPGVVEQHQLALIGLTAAQAAQVEAWAGTLLLFRDSYGNALYGTYIQTQTLHYPRSNGLAAVALTFREVSYSGEVV